MSRSSIGAWRSVSLAVRLCVLQPHRVSIGLVTNEQRATLINCSPTPEQDAALLERARGFAGVPVSHVVVTHPHHDHQFGLAGMSGITSIIRGDLLCDPGARVLDTAAAIGLSRLPTPDETFSLARSLDLGGVHPETLHLGPTHARADIAVVVPGEDVVFMGDLIENAGDPQFGPASDIDSRPKILGDALGTSTKTTCSVPGHAPADGGELTVDREFCFQQRAEIAIVQGTIEGLVYQGVTLENALGSTEWPLDKDTIRVALPLVCRRLAEKGVEPRRHPPLV